jgi:Ca2+-binding EF-hand superfamily protein
VSADARGVVRRVEEIAASSLLQLCPNGLVTLEQFKDIFSQFFPRGGDRHASSSSIGERGPENWFSDSHAYATYVFNTFDSDRNGEISFEEFVMALSVLTRGATSEKLGWIFRLYDRDHDGLLSRGDLATVLASVYQMMGKFVEPPMAETTVEDHVTAFFKVPPFAAGRRQGGRLERAGPSEDQIADFIPRPRSRGWRPPTRSRSAWRSSWRSVWVYSCDSLRFLIFRPEIVAFGESHDDGGLIFSPHRFQDPVMLDSLESFCTVLGGEYSASGRSAYGRVDFPAETRC